MAKLVSATYGDALFELALDENMLDKVWEEVKLLISVWNENREFASLLVHPRISHEEKEKLIKDVFDGKISDITMGFIMVVISKGRAGDIEAILAYLCDKAREYKNIGVAYVTSATVLSDEQKKAVEDKLLSVTKYVTYEMNYKVDASLIGGVVIRIGDRVYDSSVKNSLDRMSRELSKIQLN